MSADPIIERLDRLIALQADALDDRRLWSATSASPRGSSSSAPRAGQTSRRPSASWAGTARVGKVADSRTPSSAISARQVSPRLRKLALRPLGVTGVGILWDVWWGNVGKSKRAHGLNTGAA